MDSVVSKNACTEQPAGASGSLTDAWKILLHQTLLKSPEDIASQEQVVPLQDFRSKIFLNRSLTAENSLYNDRNFLF